MVHVMSRRRMMGNMSLKQSSSNIPGNASTATARTGFPIPGVQTEKTCQSQLTIASIYCTNALTPDHDLITFNLLYIIRPKIQLFSYSCISQLAQISRFDFHVQLKRIHVKSLDCMQCRAQLPHIHVSHICTSYFSRLNIHCIYTTS